MARDYKKGRRERESLIRELVVLGLGAREIAEMTRWSESTIVKDIQSMGGMREIAPDRPHKQEEVFAAVFQRYAELAAPTNELRSLKDMLAVWLAIDISMITRTVRKMVEALLRPSFPPELQPYFNLLEAVYGRLPTSVDLHDMQYLDDVAAKRRPTPKSKREVVEALTAQAAEACRQRVAPVWPADAKEQIDAVIATLPEQQQTVLRLRFGLDGDQAKTLKEVGAEFGRGGERARQIEEKALRQLRVKELRDKLIPLIEPLGNIAAFRAAHDEALNQAAAELQAIREQIGRLRAELEVAMALAGHASSDDSADATPLTIAPILVEEVDALLELSVRAANCLANAHIKYIWELVEKTEAEMLKSKNFGRKSLDEIKEELARHELALGTVFPPAVRLRLEAASEALYRARVSR